MRSMLSLLLVCTLAGCAFVKVNVASEPGALEERVVSGEGRAKIAVLDISGVIALGPFGLERFSKEAPLVPRLKEELERVEEDEDVVGVVVRIDSPGGAVTASDILYHELRRVREKRRIPLVACIRITSYNVCYTKLLRGRGCRRPAGSAASRAPGAARGRRNNFV